MSANLSISGATYASLRAKVGDTAIGPLVEKLVLSVLDDDARLDEVVCRTRAGMEAARKKAGELGRLGGRAPRTTENKCSVCHEVGHNARRHEDPYERLAAPPGVL